MLSAVMMAMPAASALLTWQDHGGHSGLRRLPARPKVRRDDSRGADSSRGLEPCCMASIA